MQAGKTKAERKESVGVRAADRAARRITRKLALNLARHVARVQANAWESVAKAYASPEGIAKFKAEHKRQCETHAHFKASLEQQRKAAKATIPAEAASNETR